MGVPMTGNGPPLLSRAERCARAKADVKLTTKWAVAWGGAAALGIANGTTRDLVYKNRVGDLAAHQISTGTLITVLAWYSRNLQRRWPIPTAGDAARIGGIWVSATVLFEFVFGHYVAGESWADLFRAYDVRKGRVWAAVPISMAVLPAVVR